MVVRPCTVIDTLVIGLCRVNDMCSGFATENLEWEMFRITRCSYSISRGSRVLFGRGFRLSELVPVDVTRPPTRGRESVDVCREAEDRGTGLKI